MQQQQLTMAQARRRWRDGQLVSERVYTGVTTRHTPLPAVLAGGSVPCSDILVTKTKTKIIGLRFTTT